MMTIPPRQQGMFLVRLNATLYQINRPRATRQGSFARGDALGTAENLAKDVASNS